ncbi:hypothetical protein F5B21DRAFT_521295 [Xylaria acuta]|nr:hypothetical protein F5B21DRAFT_521295 [Xylaria acuta]
MGLFLKRPGSEYIDWRLEMHQPSLRFLLEHGANVDLPRPGGLFIQIAMQQFFEDNALPYTRPSLLEHCYYYNKQMYYQLVPFSSRSTRDIYRDEICLAASIGLSSLLDYLTSKPGFDSAFLGRILAEQFFLESKYFDSTLVRTLLELGVTINTSTPEKCFTALLCCIMRKVQNFGFNEDDIFIMKALLRSGALINSEVVLLAVAEEGTRTLDLISAFGANFRREGARALCKAAHLNNFAAVSWLLRREVDINAAINIYHRLGSPGPVSITVAAALSVIPDCRVQYENWRWEWCSSADCGMLKYLLDHGAKLWVGSLDSGPFEALRVILRSSWNVTRTPGTSTGLGQHLGQPLGLANCIFARY